MEESDVTKENSMVLIQIKTAADSLVKEKPFLNEVVRFYEKVFTFQHELDPDITKDFSFLRDTKDFPLLEKKDFFIDYENAQFLLKKICALCMTSKIDADATAEIVLDAMEGSGFSLKTIVKGYLEGNMTMPLSIESKGGFNPQVFDFIIYNALKPSIVKSSKIAAYDLKGVDKSRQGRCPVCDNVPGISVFSRENGSRSLICSFCWHEWESTRIFCPFCKNQDSKTLGYVAMEEEKGIRADFCNNCKKYIKTIDLREYRGDFYLPLELIASIPFDMKMNEEGFRAE